MTTTHFGFSEVPLHEKASKVREVFDSVASNYDLMNDVMSLGMHRLWKHITCTLAHVRSGYKVLDLAGGTGDLAKTFAKQCGTEGLVIVADINADMLTTGRDKLINAGIIKPVQYCQVDAQALPFANNTFDVITIAFGLRNVTEPEMALASMARCLKPGGQCLILEFSTPTTVPLQKLYDLYSFNCIPRLGQFFAGDAASYQYLVESIRRHPNQETLKHLMLTNGFDEVTVTNMAGGIVALHRGYKY